MNLPAPRVRGEQRATRAPSTSRSSPMERRLRLRSRSLALMYCRQRHASTSGPRPQALVGAWQQIVRRSCPMLTPPLARVWDASLWRCLGPGGATRGSSQRGWCRCPGRMQLNRPVERVSSDRSETVAPRRMRAEPAWRELGRCAHGPHSWMRSPMVTVRLSGSLKYSTGLAALWDMVRNRCLRHLLMPGASPGMIVICDRK
jgi:hypothetical protein